MKFILSLAICGMLASFTQAAKLHEMCMEHSHCQNDTPGPYSYCHFVTWTIGYCECHPDWGMEDGSGTTCINPPSHLGEECELERHCHFYLGHLARCTDHICDCVTGSSPNENGTHCNPNKKVGEICSSYEECPSAGDFGGCIVLDPLSQSYTSCTCHCDSVPSEDKTKCLRLSRMNWDCEEDSQCTLGECGDTCTCKKNYNDNLRCLCIEGYAMDFDLMTCIPAAEHIGDDCRNFRQCEYYLGDLSDCVDGKCVCEENSIPDYENNFCNPINETMHN